MSEKIILSLGAGVQSSTLGLMAKHGEIGPMPDAAIFADVGAEPQSVYNWLDWLEPLLPFPVYRVGTGTLEKDSRRIRTSKKSGNKYLSTKAPYFTLSDNGHEGMLLRKCTRDYKINPIIRKVKELAGLAPNARLPKEILIEQWIGISTDEIMRVKPSQVSYIRHRHPLIDHNISRDDCFTWMENNGYPVPPRSACTFCPYHHDNEWIRLKKEEPKEFQKAVEHEQKLHDAFDQQTVLRDKPFLHSARIPLSDVTFKYDEKRQIDMFNEECEGMCGN